MDLDAMSRLVRRILEGDDRERLICLDCGFVAYENPKIVVGSIVADNDKVLLCRRAIEPLIGPLVFIKAHHRANGKVMSGGHRIEFSQQLQVVRFAVLR